MKRPILTLGLAALAACGRHPRPPGGATDDAGTAALPQIPASCPAVTLRAPVPFTPRSDGLAPLDSVAIPLPAGGDIADFSAAVRLGKALFWDTQVGGDGQMACASCHFNAGADARRTNTVSPGPNLKFESLGVTGPNQLALHDNITVDDRLGSQGVVARTFRGLSADPNEPADLCDAAMDPLYAGHRQVTARNAPSVNGAVFYRELFWDGRANHLFNGVDPFGQSGNAGTGTVQVEQSALASQAVGPPNNGVEMSCAGRGFDGPNGLGAKLLARVPLAHQVVAPDDGVLGCLANGGAPGLQCGAAPCTYGLLISSAFGDALAAKAADNFARLFGQAVAAYESTLVPDETPYDRFLRGNTSALTTRQQDGFAVFSNALTGCTNCHAGAELSDATVSFAAAHGALNQDMGDQGFHDTGVRPPAEDLGRGGPGPKQVAYSKSGAPVDQGAFKTPQLRNVGLTAPYFHNGGKDTIDDVVDFYEGGADFAGSASQVHALVLVVAQHQALVDFLTYGLTDCRVALSRAPFDHPSLEVPNGPVLPAVGAQGNGPCP